MVLNDEKAQRILDVAIDVFLTHGFSAATTDMIQKQAKVSKTTLYQYFANKELMFSAVIEYQCQKMSTVVKSIAPIARNIESFLFQVGQAYLKFIISHEGLALFRTIVAEAPRFPNLARQFYLAGPQKIIEVVAKGLQQGADAGQINIQHIGYQTAASLFVSMLRGEIQMEYLTHPEAKASDVQIDFWVKAAVLTFMNAFSTDQSQLI